MQFTSTNERRFLIVDDLHPAFEETINSLGYICDSFPNITQEETENIIHLYQGIAIRTKFRITESFLNKAPNLKYIARAGAGMDNIDTIATDKRNIICLNAPEGNANAVGEHTLGLLLTILNKISQGNIEVKSGNWNREKNRGTELIDKTIGIIGYGHMGQAFVEKVQHLCNKVLVYNKFNPQNIITSDKIQSCSLQEIFKHADVVSLHIPLIDINRHLINISFINNFLKPIYFLNTSRGEIVNHPDLVTGLENGKIIAAGLDVLEIEKIKELKEQKWFLDLCELPQVTLTPHVAGWSHESYKKISEVLSTKLKNILL